MTKITQVALYAIIASSVATPSFAAPLVSGKYAVMGSATCNARLKSTIGIYIANLSPNTYGKAVKSLVEQEGGVVSAFTGYLTVTPASAGATHGTATLTMTQIKGPNTTLNTPLGGNWTQQHITSSGGYSFTATTMNFDGDVWVMTYANVIGGIAHTINVIRRETGANPDCVDQFTAIRQ
jgi:hypothetical protein